MKRLAGFWKQIAEGWTVQRIAAVLIVAGLAVFVVGVVNKHCVCAGWPNLGDTLNDVISDFYANIAVDCLSIAFAILVIDRLNERRAEQELKAQLIREMGSKDNGIALRAVTELWAQGWMGDGSLRERLLAGANLQGVSLYAADLQGVNLDYADLQDADLNFANMQKSQFRYANMQQVTLFKANLQNANLLGANLQRAFLEGANLKFASLANADLQSANLQNADIQGSVHLSQQFMNVAKLRGAIFDGGRYDGRFNLSGDFEEAMRFNASRKDPDEMARYYGVSLEDYLAGQEWAREHLADLRRKARLDPDTGLPVKPTNSVELQPAAPAAPAPRRNGRKASMVAHQVRR